MSNFTTENLTIDDFLPKKEFTKIIEQFNEFCIVVINTTDPEDIQCTVYHEREDFGDEGFPPTADDIFKEQTYQIMNNCNQKFDTVFILFNATKLKVFTYRYRCE